MCKNREILHYSMHFLWKLIPGTVLSQLLFTQFLLISLIFHSMFQTVDPTRSFTVCNTHILYTFRKSETGKLITIYFKHKNIYCEYEKGTGS